MTDGSGRDAGEDEKRAHKGRADAGEPALREEPVAEDGGVNNLLNAIAAAAREDDAEIRLVPEDLVTSLSAAQRGHLVDQILLGQVQERVVGAHASASSGAVDALVLRRWTRSPRRRAVVLASGGTLLLAAAAAFALWFRPSDGVSPLPGFTISASGGVVELRGAGPEAGRQEGVTAASQRIRSETELRILCRPETAIAGPVAVRVFFVQGEISEEIRPATRVASTGAVEVRVRGADVIGQRHGLASLRILIGRPDAVRSYESGATQDLRWLTVPVELESP